RLIAEADAVAIGYACYLLVGLLLIPATAALNTRLGLGGGLAAATMALATFSAIAKSIGITRWLFAMPGLAQAYVAPGADQAGITLLYETLNAYAGGIGEILGVGLMSGLWTLLIASAVFRAHGLIPKLIGGFAFVTGIGLMATIPAGFGVDLGPVLTLSGVAWQFALFAIALWSLTTPRAA
ncbi:MAG: hypothetical protein K2X34_00060, partial [Hyphomonadaceae bacterium]|nr:hypothetical protein [Hyphomonadaceae bacterium]